MLKVLVTYSYFLGLRTLTVLQNAVRMANESIVKAGGAYPPGEPSLIGKKIRSNPLGGTFSLSDIPLDDPDVYAYISTGRTDGVFQIESAGMQSFMKELRPESLEDVIAGIALYRPGPMDFIPKYIKGKTDRAGISYDCPEMEPILAPTYGCIVYQEQVMQIVRDLAGYTLGRSDLVRRAMSKKKQSVMEKERHNFIYGNPGEGVPGCLEKGIPEPVADHIYDEMMDFAKYAFNKSHAACYAVLTYQTAWLKFYYPLEFMAALMTSVVDFSAKVAGYISACRSMKIRLLPPDINEGQAGFSVSGGAIRYALTAIKGLGRPVIDAIVAEREAGGKFKDLQDFLSRMTGKDREAGKRVVESLIKAGALDCLGHTRKQMMSVYLRILEDLQSSRKNEMAGQMSLFDGGLPDQNAGHRRIQPGNDAFLRKGGPGHLCQRPSHGGLRGPVEEPCDSQGVGFSPGRRDGRSPSSRRKEGDHRRHDHGKDRQVYKKEPGHGLRDPGGSDRLRGGGGLSQ